SLFFSQYSNIIDVREDLTKHEKLCYLRSALKGQALRVIEGIPIRGEFLDKSIERLKKMYDRGKQSTSALIKQILAIKPKSLSLDDQLDCTINLINKVIHLDDCSVVDNYSLINQVASTINERYIKKMYKLEPTTMMQALEYIESDIKEKIEIRDITPPCIYCGTHPFSNVCTTVTSVSDRKSILQHKKRCFNSGTITNNQQIHGSARLYTAPISIQNPTANGTRRVEALVMDSPLTKSMVLDDLSSEDRSIIRSKCGTVPDHLTSVVTPDLLLSIVDTHDILSGSIATKLSSGYTLVQSSIGPMVIGTSHKNRLCSH
ncbi:hypothetical protein PFISCL1PPCAC_18470, partial [Pristionchus fissidentatus]